MIGDATSPQLTPDFQAYLRHPGHARDERAGARLVLCHVAALGLGAPGRCPLVCASELLRLGAGALHAAPWLIGTALPPALAHVLWDGLHPWIACSLNQTCGHKHVVSIQPPARRS